MIRTVSQPGAGSPVQSSISLRVTSFQRPMAQLRLTTAPVPVRMQASTIRFGTRIALRLVERIQTVMQLHRQWRRPIGIGHHFDKAPASRHVACSSSPHGVARAVKQLW
jgi:hypothetical protein